MTLLDKIEEDFKIALKSGDKSRLSVLRLLRSALKNKEIELMRPLNDDDGIAVISSQIKQRKDSIEQYEKAGRPDLAEAERKELDILMSYLPEQLSPEEIDDIIKATIKEISAKGLQDMGKVMKAVMPRLKGLADGRFVNQRVKEILEGSK